MWDLTLYSHPPAGAWASWRLSCQDGLSVATAKITRAIQKPHASEMFRKLSRADVPPATFRSLMALNVEMTEEITMSEG